MSTDNRASIPGIVRNGVIVPQTNNELAEGMHVEFMLEPQSVPPELQEELEAWDQASDEAWAMIDKWEAEERLDDTGCQGLSQSQVSRAATRWCRS